MGSSLTGVGGRDIAVDLGTDETKVYVRGHGIVLSEPSLVAIDSRSGKVREVGIEARRMLNRTPWTTHAIRPLTDSRTPWTTHAIGPLEGGAIADLALVKVMLHHFMRKAHGRNWAGDCRMVVCVPGRVTGVEKRAIDDFCLSAGARTAYLIEEPMATAIAGG